MAQAGFRAAAAEAVLRRRLCSMELGYRHRRLYRRPRCADLGFDPAIPDRGRAGPAARARRVGVRRAGRPLQRMTGAMKDLAGGKLDVEVPGIGRRDEVGGMADAVEVFKNNASARKELEAEQKETETRAVAHRKADMIKLADDFEGAVGDIVETVSSASTLLEASAGSLTATAERAQELTTMVAAASEEASTNVQSVASATEEMTSSVNEISRQVQDSARMANEAVDQARKTNDRVSELSKAAARIGDVVELINTIA